MTRRRSGFPAAFALVQCSWLPNTAGNSNIRRSDPHRRAVKHKAVFSCALLDSTSHRATLIECGSLGNVAAVAVDEAPRESEQQSLSWARAVARVTGANRVAACRLHHPLIRAGPRACRPQRGEPRRMRGRRSLRRQPGKTLSGQDRRRSHDNSRPLW